MSNFTDFVGGGGEGFEGVDLSSAGATHTMDLSQGNYFIGGELTQDTTLAFSNVPQVAKWSYSALTLPKLEGWDLSFAEYTDKSFSVSSQLGSPFGLFFKPDGTKVYVVGASNRVIYQYSLSTAWDLSTVSYDNISFSISSISGTGARNIFFKPDGTKMYIVDVHSASVHQYSLSTAWVISSASYDNVTLNVNSVDTLPVGLFFKPDGTKVYITGDSGDRVYQYSLSTAWDLSGSSYDNVSKETSAQTTTPFGVSFKPDGTKMFVLGYSEDSIFQYSLSTAWDLSTVSYDGVSFSYTLQEGLAWSLFFKPDGNQLYIVGDQTDKIYQYEIKIPLEITFPSSVEDPSLIQTSSNKRVTYEFSTVDGGTNVQLLKQEVTP